MPLHVARELLLEPEHIVLFTEIVGLTYFTRADFVEWIDNFILWDTADLLLLPASGKIHNLATCQLGAKVVRVTDSLPSVGQKLSVVVYSDGKKEGTGFYIGNSSPTTGKYRVPTDYGSSGCAVRDAMSLDIKLMHTRRAPEQELGEYNEGYNLARLNGLLRIRSGVKVEELVNPGVDDSVNETGVKRYHADGRTYTSDRTSHYDDYDRMEEKYMAEQDRDIRRQEEYEAWKADTAARREEIEINAEINERQFGDDQGIGYFGAQGDVTVVAKMNPQHVSRGLAKGAVPKLSTRIIEGDVKPRMTHLTKKNIRAPMKDVSSKGKTELLKEFLADPKTVQDEIKQAVAEVEEQDTKEIMEKFVVPEVVAEKTSTVVAEAKAAIKAIDKFVVPGKKLWADIMSEGDDEDRQESGKKDPIPPYDIDVITPSSIESDFRSAKNGLLTVTSDFETKEMEVRTTRFNHIVLKIGRTKTVVKSKLDRLLDSDFLVVSQGEGMFQTMATTEERRAATMRMTDLQLCIADIERDANATCMERFNMWCAELKTRRHKMKDKQAAEQEQAAEFARMQMTAMRRMVEETNNRLASFANVDRILSNFSQVVEKLDKFEEDLKTLKSQPAVVAKQNEEKQKETAKKEKEMKKAAELAEKVERAKATPPNVGEGANTTSTTVKAAMSSTKVPDLPPGAREFLNETGRSKPLAPSSDQTPNTKTQKNCFVCEGEHRSANCPWMANIQSSDKCTKQEVCPCQGTRVTKAGNTIQKCKGDRERAATDAFRAWTQSRQSNSKEGESLKDSQKSSSSQVFRGALVDKIRERSLSLGNSSTPNLSLEEANLAKQKLAGTWNLEVQN